MLSLIYDSLFYSSCKEITGQVWTKSRSETTPGNCRAGEQTLPRMTSSELCLENHQWQFQNNLDSTRSAREPFRPSQRALRTLNVPGKCQQSKNPQLSAALGDKTLRDHGILKPFRRFFPQMCALTHMARDKGRVFKCWGVFQCGHSGDKASPAQPPVPAPGWAAVPDHRDSLKDWRLLCFSLPWYIFILQFSPHGWNWSFADLGQHLPTLKRNSSKTGFVFHCIALSLMFHPFTSCPTNKSFSTKQFQQTAKTAL